LPAVGTVRDDRIRPLERVRIRGIAHTHLLGSLDRRSYRFAPPPLLNLRAIDTSFKSAAAKNIASISHSARGPAVGCGPIRLSEFPAR
jgi:hypothetical protein